MTVTEARSPRPARRLRPAAVVLVVAVLLTLAGAAYGLRAYGDVRDLRDDRAAGDAAVRAASEEVLALTSISAATSDADVERLLAGATADFRDEFVDQAEAFRTALTTNDVTSTGEIDSAGLMELDGDRASVLVAASGTVVNASTTTPEPRFYRLRVDLERVEGDWLVAGLEFVA